MSVWQLIVAGALRNRLRFVLTVLGVAAVIAGLVLVRTVSDVWQLAVRGAAQNRLIVRSALPFETELPMAYAKTIAGLDSEIVHVDTRWSFDVTWGGKRPRRLVVQTSNDPRLAAPGMVVVPAQLGWATGTQARIARRHGNWRDLTVAATHADKNTLLVRSDASLDPLTTCHELLVTVASPTLAPLIAKKIDAAFGEQRVPTVTQTEHDAAARSARALGGLFAVIDLVSATLLLVLGAVVAGMIVFSTGERTTEYAVLRALGFSPALVGLCVSGEALLIAMTGALLGLVFGSIAVFSVRWATGDAALANILPHAFAVSPATLLLGFVAAASLALLASLIPALRASRVAVADELRRQG